MPKRPVTPEIDDGAKYLTVVNPYPFRPNMYLDKPRELFAQWIAACIGSTYIRAFYFKPTSPGALIVEVDESLPDFKTLLGLHKWSEFLKDTKGHDNAVSKVYYCTYSSDRIVQKNGECWKRVDVLDNWLRKRSKLFTSPYPATSWCDIPKYSDVIQNKLCRPLPLQNFPPLPHPQPAPVVGTPEWQEWKKKQDSGKPVNAWTNNGPVPVTIVPSVRSRPAWGSETTTPLSPSLPPGLTRGGSSVGDSETSTSSGSSVDNSQPLSPVGADDDGPHVGIVSENIESALEALGLGQGDQDDSDEEYHTVVGGDFVEGPLQQTQYTVLDPEEPVKSLWDDYVPSNDDDGEDDDDDEDDEGIKKAATKNPALCKFHNKVCKKGICKAYAAQLREEVKKKRQEQLGREREETQAKREKKVAKRAASLASSSTGTASGATSPTMRSPPPPPRPGIARQRPAHLQRGTVPANTPKSSPPVAPTAADDDDGDSDGAADGRVTITPFRQPEDDEVRSVSSGGWGSISEGPWGPVHRPKGNDWGAPPHNSRSNSGRSGRDSPRPPPQAQTQKAWGAWGKAASVSGSSVPRNNAAWSSSGRSVTGDEDEGDDTRSVAASQAARWGAKQPWGSTDAVKAAWPKKSWADEVEDATESGRTWGNVSVGPW